MNLSKFDPSAPWYEYLSYQAECEKEGKVDSVQEWQEDRGDVKRSKPRVQKVVAVSTPKIPKKASLSVAEKTKKTAKKRIQTAIDDLFQELTPKKDPIDDPKTKAVEIMYKGKAYPSITAAAKAHGVSAQTISRRLGRYKKK